MNIRYLLIWRQPIATPFGRHPLLDCPKSAFATLRLANKSAQDERLLHFIHHFAPARGTQPANRHPTREHAAVVCTMGAAGSTDSTTVDIVDLPQDVTDDGTFAGFRRIALTGRRSRCSICSCHWLEL